MSRAPGHSSRMSAATSRQREVVLLTDRDEVDARLPILAMRFGASLMQATTLDVTMMVVGRYESSAAPVTTEISPDCISFRPGYATRT